MTALEILRDAVSWVLLLGGGFFCIVGGIGLVKFDSFYQRIHAAGVTDSLGAALIVAGLIVQAPSVLVAAKLLLLVAFLWVTGPTATHALVKAAYSLGLRADIDLPAEARHPDVDPVSGEDDAFGTPHTVEGIRYGEKPE